MHRSRSSRETTPAAAVCALPLPTVRRLRPAARWIRHRLRRLAVAAALLCGPPASAQDDLLSVAGWRVAIDCAGPRDQGVTVWLEHGIGDRASATTWNRVFPLLARSVHVCRYDRPGAGRSPAAPAYGPQTYLNRVAAMLVSSGACDRLVVAGHSFGGYPARILAQAWPLRVHEVILIETPGETLGLRAATGASGWSDLPVGAEPISVRHFEEALAPALAMPVTVISRGHGTTDRWEHAQRHLLRLSGHSRRIVAEASGHMIPLEDPLLVVRAIEAAVRRAGGRSCDTRAAPELQSIFD